MNYIGFLYFLKLVRDRQTDRQTDGKTDQPTDIVTYRAAIAAKKIYWTLVNKIKTVY